MTSASRQAASLHAVCNAVLRSSDLVCISCRAESLFSAYYFFTRKGYEVTLASVKGGKLPIDPKSVVTPYLTTVVKKGLTDGTASRLSCHYSLTSQLPDITASQKQCPLNRRPACQLPACLQESSTAHHTAAALDCASTCLDPASKQHCNGKP